MQDMSGTVLGGMITTQRSAEPTVLAMTDEAAVLPGSKVDTSQVEKLPPEPPTAEWQFLPITAEENFTLEKLPPELHTIVRQFLPTKAEESLAATCRSFYTQYKKYEQIPGQRMRQILKQCSECHEMFDQANWESGEQHREKIWSKLASRPWDESSLALFFDSESARTWLSRDNCDAFIFQKIAGGHITFQEVRKLDAFVKSYLEQQFSDENHEVVWMADQLLKDETEILYKYFSSGPNWSNVIQGIYPHEFNLSIALLFCSSVVQKYVAGDLDTFCGHLSHHLPQYAELAFYLNALNNPLVQTYLDEEKLSLPEFFSIHAEYIEHLLQNPVVKEYFDDGSIPTVRAMFEMFGSEASYKVWSFSSPTIRAAFKNKEFTLRDLVALKLNAFSDNDLDKVKQAQKEQIFWYFYYGKLRFNQIKNLTAEQVADLTLPEVVEKIACDELTVEDVLIKSDQFLWTCLPRYGLSEFVINQLQQGHLAFQDLYQLSEFVKSYKAQQFADEAARIAWIENALMKDKVLSTHFVDCHVMWSIVDTYLTPEKFDVNIALLLCSAGVRKYAQSVLKNFDGRIFKRAEEPANDFKLSFKKSTNSTASWQLKTFTAYLEALNDPVFQTYLDEQKITIDDLFVRDDQPLNIVERDIALLRSPVVRRYVDEGYITTVEELWKLPEHIKVVLVSPVVRAAFENKRFNWKELMELNPTTFVDDTTDLGGYSDKDKLSNDVRYFLCTQFAKGKYTFKEIQNLTREQVEPLINTMRLLITLRGV